MCDVSHDVLPLVLTAAACDTGWFVVTAPTGSCDNGFGKRPKRLGAAANTGEHNERTLESTAEALDTEETMWVRVLVSVLAETAVDVAWLLDTVRTGKHAVAAALLLSDRRMPAAAKESVLTAAAARLTASSPSVSSVPPSTELVLTDLVLYGGTRHDDGAGCFTSFCTSTVISTVS